jgi:hypothetical protein
MSGCTASSRRFRRPTDESPTEKQEGRQMNLDVPDSKSVAARPRWFEPTVADR